MLLKSALVLCSSSLDFWHVCSKRFNKRRAVDLKVPRCCIRLFGCKIYATRLFWLSFCHFHAIRSLHPKIKRERGRGEGVKKQHIWGGGQKVCSCDPFKKWKTQNILVPWKSIEWGFIHNIKYQTVRPFIWNSLGIGLGNKLGLNKSLLVQPTYSWNAHLNWPTQEPRGMTVSDAIYRSWGVEFFF